MRRILLNASFILCTSALAQASPDVPSIQHQQDYAEVLKIFRTETGFEEIDRGEILQFIDKKYGRVFLVTKPGHPAHPAVVTRQAIERNGQLFVKSDGIGQGDQKALKIWINFLDSEAQKAVDEKRQGAGKQ